MPTVTIRKHPTRDEIQVDPEIAVVGTNERLTFKVSGENGFEPGTRVTVKFHPVYRVVPMLQLQRAAVRRGPFARCSDERRNPDDGHFEFDAECEVETGDVADEPWSLLPHVWKYDVSWTGLPDLDPIIKIEKRG